MLLYTCKEHRDKEKSQFQMKPGNFKKSRQTSPLDKESITQFLKSVNRQKFPRVQIKNFGFIYTQFPKNENHKAVKVFRFHGKSKNQPLQSRPSKKLTVREQPLLRSSVGGYSENENLNCMKRLHVVSQQDNTRQDARTGRRQKA